MGDIFARYQVVLHGTAAFSFVICIFAAVLMALAAAEFGDTYDLSRINGAGSDELIAWRVHGLGVKHVRAPPPTEQIKQRVSPG